MNEWEKVYLRKLCQHAQETRELLSNANKAQRERMVVRAFLRCVGVPFSDHEFRAAGKNGEPVDVFFNAARFQIRDIVGNRLRGKEWADRQQHWKKAAQLSEVLEPNTPPEPMPFHKLATNIAQALAKKARKYGAQQCASLDALVYIDLTANYLTISKETLCPEATDELDRQGWRSVSFLFVPKSGILIAKASAPDFLKENVGRTLNEWPHPGGWFDST
jgi:hypothetical protein